MKINRKKFFDGFRPYFKQIVGKALTVTQVANLEFLLGAFEKSTWFSVDVRRIAYAIATIHIETYLPRINSRYAPVTEGGSKSYFNRYDKSTNPRKARELGNIEVGDGYRYRGRGYCQITGRNNYRKFGIEDNPEMALDPQTAFNILERGMREGTFTGKKIIDYINTSGADYKNARRVINGQDRAAEIAGYARNIEHFLREAISGEDNNNTTANAVTAPVADPPKSTDELAEQSSPEHTEITQNADTIINEESLMDKANKAGDKLQSVQGTLDKFGFSIEDAKRSIGTVVLTYAKYIGGLVMLGLSYALNHWEYILIAVLLFVLAYLLWDRSGKRVAEAKAGVPKDIAEKLIEQK